MAYSSYYTEGIYFINEDRSPVTEGILHETIGNMLNMNTAVGIIGGKYDEDGQYFIDFISSFALTLMQIDIDEFEEMGCRRLIDMIGEHDKAYVTSIMSTPSGEHLLRLKIKGHMSLWVKAIFGKYTDKKGIETWVMSICYIQNVIDTINKCTNSIFCEIFDVENDLLYTQKGMRAEKYFLEDVHTCSYSEILELELENSIYSEYRDFAQKALDINAIKKSLEKETIYEVTIPQRIIEDEPMIVRHKFVYLDESRRFIIITGEDITELFSYDAATGCLNMNGFYMSLKKAVTKTPDDYALIFFNIKNFKAYNEAYGFERGSRLLSDTVSYIGESSIKPILLAREESDHFICLAKRKNVSMEDLNEICNFHNFKFEKNIKLVMYCGVYNIDKERLKLDDLRDMCRYAKTAQQQVGDDILHPIRVYIPEYTEKNMMAVDLIDGFQDALKEKQFKVYYQPIYDTKTKKLSSAEALARWEHPKHGMVSPGIFIPLFEKYGLVTKLDDYISKNALEYAAQRVRKGKTIVPLSVNFSRVDVGNTKDVERMLVRVQNSILPVNYCRLEITESAYTALDHALVGFMKQLHDAGAKILIDDFGSGYSSFSSMADYPYDYLKIDMEFARMINENEKANGIIRNIIRMCHDLDVQVIAEGIETEEQYQFMLENDCDFIQGYYFSKPLREEDFSRLLDQSEICSSENYQMGRRFYE